MLEISVASGSKCREYEFARGFIVCIIAEVRHFERSGLRRCSVFKSRLLAGGYGCIFASDCRRI